MSAEMGAYDFAAAFHVLRVEAASSRVFAPASPRPTDFAQELVRRARAELHAEARQSLLCLYLSVTYSEAGG